MEHPDKRRMTAHERRASIIARSKQLFAKKGLHGVSVDEIAGACEISPAILYRHFESKTDLYAAVLNEFACNRDAFVDAALSGSTAFGDVLLRVTLVYVKSRLKDPDSVRIELRSIIDGEAATEQFFQNQWKGLTDFIEASLTELVESGDIPPTNVAMASLCYTGMVRELVVGRTCGVGRKNRRIGADADVRDLIRLYLRMVGVPD
jgi:AcrR family transcriptional regulator